MEESSFEEFCYGGKQLDTSNVTTLSTVDTRFSFQKELNRF